MNVQNKPDQLDEDKPLDPATEKVRKKLVKFSAVFMGLNMLALMAVLAAIVYKIGGFGDERPAISSISQSGAPVDLGFEGVIDIPDGAKVISASQGNGNLVLTLQQADGSNAVWFYDIASSRVTGKLAVK